MGSPQHVDCVIHARWILPIVPQKRVFEHCSLILQDGKILEIVPSNEVHKRYSPQQEVRLDKHILLPGLINCHGHAAMSLLRGVADDLPLMTWLQEHIWPAEQEWVSDTFVADGTELAIAEMLLSGTTCFSDMYFFPECAAEVAHRTGIRAQIASPVLDFPTAWANNADEYIAKSLALIDRFRNHPRIQVGFGPHAPYTVSDEPLQRIATLAEQLQAPIHIHVHETAYEVSQSLHDHGVRPLQRLNELGVLGPRTQCVHMTQVAEADISLLQQSGAAVIHCPQSNLKLASGLCPVNDLLKAGIPVGLGTDSAASNNGLSMLCEMQTAALVGKIAAADASAVDAWQTLEMATLGGARALGLEGITGSLEPHKAADIIALEIDHPGLMPMYDAASMLVYNNRHAAVTHVWVDGHLLVHDKNLLTLSTTDVVSRAQAWQQRIQPKTATK